MRSLPHVLGALAFVACLAACTDPKSAPPPGTLTIAQEQQASWVRTFNPFLPTGTSRWPTRGGIYETLLIYNTMAGRYVPWLATAWSFSEDGRQLTFRTRSGVAWSDGVPFTAADVAFTLELIHQHPALDIDGIWKHLAGVQHEEGVVRLSFSQPFVPGLYYLSRLPIAPAHIWSDVEDPVLFANPSPVATGPFTEVLRFEHQLFELGRNPNYWQPGKPEVERLRFPAFSTNDQANLALVHGEVDWSGKFIPAVERTFVRRDPQHHRYWFPLVNGVVMLYPNTQRPPLDDARVRKALSLAIDREQLVDVAVYGYSRPADATALSDAYLTWKDPMVVEDRSWVVHDARRAEAELDALGFGRGEDGVRVGPSGKRLELDIEVVVGWSDWVRAAQVLAHNLRDVGVEARVVAYDFAAWFDRLHRGSFSLSIGWTVEGPSPYHFYRALMASATRKPIGEVAVSNWNRFSVAEVDRALDELERTVEPGRQHELSNELQRAFARHAPAIPLFFNPSWGAFSDARFSHFPNASDPYAKLTPNDQPDALLVLTQLEPKP